MIPDRIFHLAISSDWERAKRSGTPYDRSTVGVSLADEGFIHCSFSHQVAATAERYYAGRDDVVVLVIDPSLLGAEIRIEDLRGSGVEFPHIYGPIPVDAVESVIAVADATRRKARTVTRRS